MTGNFAPRPGEPRGLLFSQRTRVHFVGIGGVGMSGLAEVLLSLGYRVTGSDIRFGESAHRLADLGAVVFEGHAAKHVRDADVVVVSSAIGAANPEVAAAAERQLPIIPRAEMLAELMRMKFAIAVAGSHGKTTTTSMIAALLEHAGLDPTVVIGGRVARLGGGARLGDSEILVAEADESDRSFLGLLPVVAAITGIDREHLDAYADMDDLRESFLQFANKVPFYGCVALSADDPNLAALLPRVRRRFVLYGLSPEADISASEIESDANGARFQLRIRGGAAGPVTLCRPGLVTVRNALAAAAIGLELGIPARSVRKGLEAFSGVDRRFDLRAVAAGVRIVDDYAHHPNEIRATLEAAKSAYATRTIAVFEPHRYSRARDLAQDFARAFDQADAVVVTEVHPAGEDPIPGIDGAGLARGIREAGHADVRHFRTHEEIVAHLASRARPGDVVLTLGAGSITRLPDLLKERLLAAAS